LSTSPLQKTPGKKACPTLRELTGLRLAKAQSTYRDFAAYAERGSTDKKIGAILAAPEFYCVIRSVKTDFDVEG
jgi:hypothetical protein